MANRLTSKTVALPLREKVADKLVLRKQRERSWPDEGFIRTLSCART